MKKLIVIDGQGGRIGCSIIEEIMKSKLPVEILAVGTNTLATQNMIKSGAKKGATGENAVVVNAKKADIIIGPIGVVIADALLGEVSPKMAAAIGSSNAVKLLIPINHCENIVVGVKDFSINAMKESVIDNLKSILDEK